jgi:hypothetical protein
MLDILIDNGQVVDGSGAPRYAIGIPHVIVNGALVIHDGLHTQARPGSVLGR